MTTKTTNYLSMVSFYFILLGSFKPFPFHSFTPYQTKRNIDELTLNGQDSLRSIFKMKLAGTLESLKQYVTILPFITSRGTIALLLKVSNPFHSHSQRILTAPFRFSLHKHCGKQTREKRKCTLPTQALSCSGSKGLSQPKPASICARRLGHPRCVSSVSGTIQQKIDKMKGGRKAKAGADRKSKKQEKYLFTEP